MKQTLAVVLVASLLCILAGGTTSAYLATSELGVSSMPIGKVAIRQNGTDGSETLNLQPVTQDLVTGEWTPVENKPITVTLFTDSAPAYVRTIFAFKWVDGKDPMDSASPTLHAAWNNGGELAVVADTDGRPLAVSINNEAYTLYSYTYLSPVDPGTTTLPSLQQIYLNSTATAGEFEILIISQAVPTAGYGSAAQAFSAAFPVDPSEPAKTYAAWFQANKP